MYMFFRLEADYCHFLMSKHNIVSRVDVYSFRHPSGCSILAFSSQYLASLWLNSNHLNLRFEMAEAYTSYDLGVSGRSPSKVIVCTFIVKKLILASRILLAIFTTIKRRRSNNFIIITPMIISYYL